MAEITLEQVEALAHQLPVEEQRLLAERLALQLNAQAAAPERQYQDLYGIWRGKFPDFDLDAALYEIRHEWEQELEEPGS
jgi:hypothetical protein